MVRQDLLDSVRSKINAGLSKEQIQNLLSVNGWSATDIRAAFETLKDTKTPQETPVVKNTTVNKKSNGLLVIGAILVAIIALTAIVYVFTSVRSPQQTYGIVQSTHIENNLLAYSSQTSKFTIQYPQEWPMTKIPAECTPCVERFVFAPTFDWTKQDQEKIYLPDNKYAFINVLKMNIYKTYEQKENSLKRDKDVSNISYLMIGGEKAISWEENRLNPNILRIYWVLYNGMEYNFTLYKNEQYAGNEQQYKSNFETILSTIHFL